MTAQRVTTIAFIVVLASSVGLSQVKTTVPDVVPGARPATVARITIHGKALEGNLEGDAVLVCLSPTSARLSRTATLISPARRSRTSAA